jgi:DNA-binding NarL/FixJ family response regulator
VSTIAPHISTPRAADPEPGRDVRVLVVDDQERFRAVAREVIAATDGFALAGEAEDGGGAIAAAARLEPDLVLMDVRMPGLDGIAAARQLRRCRPGTVVVLITIGDSRDEPLAGARAGGVPLARKQDFGPRLLRALWHEHGAR